MKDTLNRIEAYLNAISEDMSSMNKGINNRKENKPKEDHTQLIEDIRPALFELDKRLADRFQQLLQELDLLKTKGNKKENEDLIMNVLWPKRRLVSTLLLLMIYCGTAIFLIYTIMVLPKANRLEELEYKVDWYRIQLPEADEYYHNNYDSLKTHIDSVRAVKSDLKKKLLEEKEKELDSLRGLR